MSTTNNKEKIDIQMSTALHIHLAYRNTSPVRLPTFGTAAISNRFSALPDDDSGDDNTTDGGIARHAQDIRRFLQSQLPGAHLMAKHNITGLMRGNGCKREDPELSHRRSLRLVRRVIDLLEDIRDTYDDILADEEDGGVPIEEAYDGLWV